MGGGKEAREDAGEGERVLSVCAVWERGWRRLGGQNGGLTLGNTYPVRTVGIKKLPEAGHCICTCGHVWDLGPIPINSSHLVDHILLLCCAWSVFYKSP